MACIRPSLLKWVVMLVVFLSGSEVVSSRPAPSGFRKLSFLVSEPQTVLTYHNGLMLSGEAQLSVYIIWYGNFSDTQRSIVRDFLASTSSTDESPSVSSWWKIIGNYKDSRGASVGSTINVAAELSEDYTKGLLLSNADLEALVVASLATFPADANAVYFILTADDVSVEDFCSNSCASHFATAATTATSFKQLAFAWVGNPGTQCAGRCAWPYAQEEFGPDSKSLLPPNGDVGMEGLIINMAYMLAGTTTNPFNNGYYQGDAAAPLEAATACEGLYATGAYQGYPGNLLVDNVTHASYNSNGINSRKFLIPMVWDPATSNCTPPS